MWTNRFGSGLARLAGLKSLAELDLTACPVNDEDAAQIAELAGLERLSLSGSDISNAAVAALARLPALKSLNLNSTDIGDPGLRLFVQVFGLSAVFCTLQTALPANLFVPDRV